MWSLSLKFLWKRNINAAVPETFVSVPIFAQCFGRMILQFRVLLFNVCASVYASCVGRIIQQFCFHLPPHLWLHATCSKPGRVILLGEKERMPHNVGSFCLVSRVVRDVCVWTVLYSYSMVASAVSCLVSMPCTHVGTNSWHVFCKHSGTLEASPSKCYHF